MQGLGIKKNSDKNWNDSWRARGHWGLEIWHGDVKAGIYTGRRITEMLRESWTESNSYSKEKSIISEYLMNPHICWIIKSFVSIGF